MVAIGAIVVPVVAGFLGLAAAILSSFAFALDEEIHSTAAETAPTDGPPEDRTEAPAAD